MSKRGFSMLQAVSGNLASPFAHSVAVDGGVAS